MSLCISVKRFGLTCIEFNYFFRLISRPNRTKIHLRAETRDSRKLQRNLYILELCCHRQSPANMSQYAMAFRFDTGKQRSISNTIQPMQDCSMGRHRRRQQTSPDRAKEIERERACAHFFLPYIAIYTRFILLTDIVWLTHRRYVCTLVHICSPMKTVDIICICV